MSHVDFDQISRRYERDSLVQKAAAEVLLGLLGLEGGEDVLDLGCGPGHLSRRIADITSGQVVGLDSSAAMVAEARAKYGGPRLRFEVGVAEELDRPERFDAIFCNSALQWFRDPARALVGCGRALRAGGRLALQAPARTDYCPSFLAGVAEVARHPETAAIYARFAAPWFLLETSDAYAELLAAAGLAVGFARIEATRSRHTPERVLEIFDSGAAAGYLNAEHYGRPLPEAYVASFRRILAEEFRRQAGEDGLVDLVFHRIFALAVKPA